MNRFVRLLQSYLLYGFPFVVALFLWLYFGSSKESMFKTILSFHIMFWMVSLIIFLVLLVVVPSVRENTLQRLANLNERDEREEYITGKAARASYIATLSLMILFLFMSVFTIQLRPITENNGIKDKPHWSLEMNLKFQMLDAPIVNNAIKSPPVFSSENIMPSKSMMILILMFWQLLTFNLAARREKIRGCE